MICNTTVLLEHSFAELSIQDETRKSLRMTLPKKIVVTQFNLIATSVMARMSPMLESHRRDVVTFFGAPTIVIAKIWELVEENNRDRSHLISKKEHLLWALHFMKHAPNVSILCKTMTTNLHGTQCPSEKTARKWIWFYVKEIAALDDIVILWENRKTNDRGDDCLASVDCIDCPFQQILIDHPTKPGKKTINKALYSSKFNGPALRYEVAISLLSDDIVWINGPYCPGDWNDLDIFRHSLIEELEAGERIEADNGYIGEAPTYVVCPAACTTKEEAVPMMKRVEGRHEALNRHLKNWKCLQGRFNAGGTPQEKLEKHGSLFRACAVMKQVAMQLGVGELFSL